MNWRGGVVGRKSPQAGLPDAEGGIFWLLSVDESVGCGKCRQAFLDRFSGITHRRCPQVEAMAKSSRDGSLTG